MKGILSMIRDRMSNKPLGKIEEHDGQTGEAVEEWVIEGSLGEKDVVAMERRKGTFFQLGGRFRFFRLLLSQNIDGEIDGKNPRGRERGGANRRPRTKKS